MRRVLTRDQALAIFERFRAIPGSPIDESNFLDYLLENPREKGAVHDSFEGKRRFNSFIEAIQLELGICFSQADLERPFSVDAFVERANALQTSRKGSLASLKNRERAGAGWAPVVVLDLILICTASWFSERRTVLVIALTIAAALTAAFAIFALRGRRDLARLRARIESEPPLAPPNNSLERSRER